VILRGRELTRQGSRFSKVGAENVPEDAEMSAPQCVECRTERVSVGIEWATPIYQINSYQCPVCKTMLRLVEPRAAVPTYH
jgi:hypothetical protein